MYFDGAGQPIVMCNSLKSAYELMERRSSNYSDRPQFIVAQDYLNGGLLFGLMNYTDRYVLQYCNSEMRLVMTLLTFLRWRRMRRAAHEALTKRAVQSYHPIQMKEATILVSSLLKRSASLEQEKHFKRLAASTMMSIIYDHPTIMSEHDHAVGKIKVYNDRMSHASNVGSYFVDIFPWMNYIPERSWLSVCGLIVNADGQTKQDSQSGSAKAYGHLRNTLKCSEVFSIASKLTWYVFIRSVISGTY